MKYKKHYPEAQYPRPTDATGFIPVLIKSKIWKYESEFRIVFTPEADTQPNNDGQSLLLFGDEIKNVYLGSRIEDEEKQALLDIIKRSRFTPNIWKTSTSESSFSLEFNQIG